jgi:hypothetical protein
MKHLLLKTIAAVLLIGCGLSPDQSGTYILAYDGKDTMTLDLKPDGSFTGIKKDRDNDDLIGSWKVEGELLIIEGTPEKSSEKIVLKFNKTTKKWISLRVDGEIMRLKDAVPEGEDNLYLKKLNPVAEMSQAEPLAGKAPDILDAIISGNIEVVRQHIAAGTDVNEKSGKDVPSLLHWAVAEENEEIIKLLILAGADVNAKGKTGRTALDTAINITASYDRNHEIVDLLRKHGGKTKDWLRAEESIFIATSAGRIEAVERHLADGADVNEKDARGQTSLHIAAAVGHKEIVELLIAEGSDVNEKDGEGETPLDWANSHRRAETADLLRKHGGKTGKELKAEGK